MGARSPPTGVMRWQSTLGDMKLYGSSVIRSCTPCGVWGEVDLDHMADLLGGPEMTLWDCRPPCPFCGGPMLHLASPGRSTPMRPLTSHPGDSEQHPLPPQAWMAGWTGRQWW